MSVIFYVQSHVCRDISRSKLLGKLYLRHTTKFSCTRSAAKYLHDKMQKYKCKHSIALFRRLENMKRNKI